MNVRIGIPSYAPAVSLMGSALGTAAQISAAFAPVPWLSPAVQVLLGMVELYQNVDFNKKSVQYLLVRCRHMLESLAASHKDKQFGNMTNLDTTVQSCVRTLTSIQERLNSFATLGRIKSFLQQEEIRQDVQKSHMAISDCCSSLSITSGLEINNWQKDFQYYYQEDHKEVVSMLTNIREQSDFQIAVSLESSNNIKAVMGMLQQVLGNFEVGDTRHSTLQNNLYGIQMKSKQLLPNVDLHAGEVRRLGNYPVGGSAAFDIWEGEYLGREKCAIKVIRSVDVSPDAMRRFFRETEIWRTIWELDQGRYILPFYGVCRTDGPYPYVVSPWMRNGDALTFVRKYPQTNRKRLIRRIAEGLNILHTHQPPIAHGDIKACNILIDDIGNPKLADFGLSRILEDITGVPFTQSRGVSESFRWFAPELSFSPNIISTKSDVFAFGMTTLELMTGEQPFAEIRRTTEVLIKLQSGGRPNRPNSAEILSRGLNDELWNLLIRCWSTSPDDRPTIAEVLESLPSDFVL